MKTAFTFL